MGWINNMAEVHQLDVDDLAGIVSMSALGSIRHTLIFAKLLGYSIRPGVEYIHGQLALEASTIYAQPPMTSFRLMGIAVCDLKEAIMADTREELDQMADAIGVARKWIQKAGTPEEHYDIALAAKAKALELGAQQVTMHFLGKLCMDRWKALKATQVEINE